MEAVAKLRHARMSPQKVRLVIDQIRGLPVERALNLLAFDNKMAAGVVKKLLESAIANAEHNVGADVDDLRVSAAWVDQGPVMKRVQARAKGRANRVVKRSSHITVTVADSK